MRNKIIIAVSALLCIGAFFILPVYDDFYYLSSPHKSLDMESLLPNGSFWRPIDALWGGIIAGKLVSLFPFLNHLLVILCFAYASYGLIKVLKYCNVGGFSLSLAMSMFMLSPALVATTYSIDATNQALSLAFGIGSLSMYRKHKPASYLLMALSLFSKESGIAWFVVTPLLSMVIEHGLHDGKKIDKSEYMLLIKPYCISIIAIMAYAALRYSLNIPVETAAGYTDRYTPHIGLNNITSLCIITGLALTVVDTIALFIEHNFAVVGITALVSVITILIIARKSYSKANLSSGLPLIVCILAISSPHMIMSHPSEMHIYPSLWMIALTVGVLTKDARWKRGEVAVASLFIACGVLVFMHKGYYMYVNGKIADKRVTSAVSHSKGIPEKVCVLDCDRQLPAYSVFQIDGKRCWDSGKGTRLRFDLENPKTVTYHVIDAKALRKYIDTYTNKDSTYNALWIVKDNNVEVIDIPSSADK